MCSCIQCASLPTCLCSKGRGGGSRPQHVLPITSQIWKSKSELEGVRVRLPTWQGKGSRSIPEPPSPMGPSCDFPSTCKLGEKGRRQGAKKARSPQQSSSTWGLCSTAIASWEGTGLPWRTSLNSLDLQGLNCPSVCLGRRQGKSREGSLARASFSRGTAQLAMQYATYGLFELPMGNTGIASGDFTQGQGDPASRQMAIPALAPILVSWERSVPSLCLHINTPKHHFLSHGYAAGT